MLTTESSTGSHVAIPQTVKVFATTQQPDFRRPWRQGTAVPSTGSGVVIAPGEILTGAHVVANATFIQVQKVADPDKATARVKAVCHDSDLALLSVDDEKFLRGTTPVPVGELCSLRDKVMVVGFPMGGEEISITEGVVSRMEAHHYAHSQRRLLTATVDAAINPGNSGGPVLRGGKLVGVAFQKIMFGAEGLGYIVPAPLVRRFLDGVAHGRPLEVPSLGAYYQVMDNLALRQRFGLADDQRGIMVMMVEYGGSAWGQLLPRDVVLEIDGLPVANNGTIRYLDRFRTDMEVVLGDHFIGDQLGLSILRDGERKELSLTLGPEHRLVPGPLYDEQPTYFIYGGVVFQKLVRNMFETELFGDDDALPHDLYSAAWQPRTEQRQELVILSSILAHEINVGFEEMMPTLVNQVNGVVPRDMAHLVDLIEKSADWVEITAQGNALMVLDARRVRAANQEILRRYRIERDRSPDLPSPTDPGVG